MLASCANTVRVSLSVLHTRVQRREADKIELAQDPCEKQQQQNASPVYGRNVLGVNKIGREG